MDKILLMGKSKDLLILKSEILLLGSNFFTYGKTIHILPTYLSTVYPQLI